MKTIIIITGGTLPVPPVKGGAVENLVQIFLDQNEKNCNFKIIIFSVKHFKAVEIAKLYTNTEFIFIDSETLFYKIGQVIRFLINKLTGHLLANQFIQKVLKYKEILFNADMILIENNPYFAKHIRKISNKPIGLHLHNDYLNINHEKSSRKILNQLDFVIAVSKYIEKRINEISPPSLNVSYVYNGINTQRFNVSRNKSERNSLRQKFGFSSEDIVIVYSGRLQEHKGVRILVESFLELNKALHAKLLIIGGSEFGNSKKTQFIKELEKIIALNKSSIILTGYINYETIHQYYSMGDFAVLPSLCEEAFGLTSIEAMACGLPVIVTDAGGLPETINADCGFIIKRDANLKTELIIKMEELIKDTRLRTSMSIEARKRAMNFNENRFYQSLAKCINSTIV